MNRKTVSFIAICMYLFLIPISYGYAAPPAPPVLSSPASNANVPGASVTLSWNASPGGSQYNLWVRRTSDNVVIFNQNVGDLTSYTLTGLPNNGSDYFWMVRAGSYSSGWGVWSSARRFYNGGGTATLPAPPVLISPASNANAAGTSVNLSWSASSGANQYWLWVKRVSDGVVIFNQSVGNTTYRALSLPNNGGDYFWMVRAGNSSGWSGWPAARKFINGAAAIPAPPTLLLPASNAYAPGTTVNLSWSPSSGATYYYLWVKRASDGVVIYNHSVVGQTFYPLSLPNNGGTYFWMVRAYNGSGGSAWTAARGFINGGAAPCTYSILPASIGSFASGSGSQSVTITASSTSCAWTTSGPSWVTVSPASGTGSKTVTIKVNANTGAARSGSITIAGKLYNISQAGGTSSGLTTDIEKYMAMVTSVGDMSPMLDEIGTLLGEVMGDSSIVTITPPPPLDIENPPSTITITANFGSGYSPEGSSSVYTGSAVINITNLNVSDTGISANVTVTATNVKRDGKLILNGGMTLVLNIGISDSNMALTANVSFSNLQSLDYQIHGGLSLSAPSVNSSTETFSPMTITFNQLKTKDFTFSSGTVTLTQNGSSYDAVFNLNSDLGAITGTARVNTSNPNQTVISTPTTMTAGRYTLDINNVMMDASDAATCTKLPISGDIVITGNSETKTITFKSPCTYIIN